MRAARVLGAVLLFSLSGCELQKLERLVDIPSKFELYGFDYSQNAALQIRGWLKAISDNRGTNCATVKGTIDWGDGVTENKDYISPCISVTNRSSWMSSPLLSHAYPAVGSYTMKAELTAEFSNGSVTSKFQKEIVITY